MGLARLLSQNWIRTSRFPRARFDIQWQHDLDEEMGTVWGACNSPLNFGHGVSISKQQYISGLAVFNKLLFSRISSLLYGISYVIKSSLIFYCLIHYFMELQLLPPTFSNPIFQQVVKRLTAVDQIFVFFLFGCHLFERKRKSEGSKIHVNKKRRFLIVNNNGDGLI